MTKAHETPAVIGNLTETNAATYKYSGNPSGNVVHHVTVEVKNSETSFVVSLSIVWEPGVAIEVDCFAARSASDTNALHLSFTDNFGNLCRGKMEFEVDHMVISLEAVAIVESRAARQYCVYKLSKQ